MHMYASFSSSLSQHCSVMAASISHRIPPLQGNTEKIKKFIVEAKYETFLMHPYYTII